MQILCLGLSYHTAPVEVRERLAYSPRSLQAALARFGCGRQDGHPYDLIELVILSTCNRLELYAVSHAAQFAGLIEFASETTGVPSAAFTAHLYQYQAAEAVQHLLRVAAGLDSMVLGEPQILGQVTDAYETARGQGATGTVLSALLRSAIHSSTEGRRYTLRDTPLHTALYHPAEETLTLWR